MLVGFGFFVVHDGVVVNTQIRPLSSHTVFGFILLMVYVWSNIDIFLDIIWWGRDGPTKPYVKKLVLVIATFKPSTL